MRKQKIVAVASIGGHWVQLLRITRSMEQDYEVIYCSTHEKCATMVSGKKFYLMPDFSRWDAWKLVPSFFQMLRLVWKEKPETIITTGAAPGLVCLLAGKVLGKKTIWVDSIANVQHLSACGRIAHKFVSRIYTQWPDLAMDDIVSAGNVFG